MRLPDRLHRLRRDERGIALYLTLVMITLTLTFSLAAVSFVMAGTSQSVSDAQGRRALAAAQSAMRMAVYRTNQTAVDLQLSAGAALTASNCLVAPLPGLNLGIVNVPTGWCSGSPIDLGASASGTYQISPAVNIGLTGLPNLIGSLLPGTYTPIFRRTIVATGTAGGRTRRVAEDISLRVTIKIGLLGLGSTLDVRAYQVVPGSFRQCTDKPTGATPDTGC
jgi:hypothetical protein